MIASAESRSSTAVGGRSGRFQASANRSGGITPGCGGSTPAYCSAASGLKTSVQNLDKVDVRKNGLGPMKTALDNVSSNANTFISEAKSAFSSQTAALRSSLSDVNAAIKSALQQPSVAAIDAVAGAVRQVKNSASAVENAVAGECQ